LKAPLASIALDPLQRLPLIARVGAGGRLDLAESLMAEGKLLRADEQIDQVLSDDANLPRALFMKGRVLKERGDWAGAMAQWSKVLTLASAPDDASRLWSQIWTARLYDLQGKRPDAVAIYTTVAGLPEVRGSKGAAAAGIQSPFTDAWPPLLP
jgi:tetratricopeptide (TPR) repeat protein